MLYVLYESGKIRSFLMYKVWDSDDCSLESRKGRDVINLYKSSPKSFGNLLKDMQVNMDYVLKPKYHDGLTQVGHTGIFLWKYTNKVMCVWSNGMLYKNPIVAGRYPLQTHMPVMYASGGIKACDNLYGLLDIALGEGEPVTIEQIKNWRS